MWDDVIHFRKFPASFNATMTVHEKNSNLALISEAISCKLTRCNSPIIMKLESSSIDQEASRC